MSTSESPSKRSKSNGGTSLPRQTLEDLIRELAEEQEKLEILEEELVQKYNELQRAELDRDNFRDYVGQLKCRILMRRLQHGPIVQEEARRINRSELLPSSSTASPSEPTVCELIEVLKDPHMKGPWSDPEIID